MTLQEFKTMLAGTTLSVAYYAFPEGEAPPLPFVCYFETGTDNFSADGKVYHVIRKMAVELYSKNRDLANEANLESAFASNNIYWQKEITFLDDEKCYEVIYTMEV